MSARSSVFFMAGALCVFTACNQGDKTPDSSEGITDDSAPSETGSSDGLMATIGSYTQESDGSFTDTGRTLVIEVGATCFVWTRNAQPHGAQGGLSEETEVHDHFNASGSSSYVDGTFTWTEFGPEHNQGDIDATCGAGQDGVTKAVNETDYFEDHGGLFLRLLSVQ